MSLLHLVRKVVLETHYSYVMRLESKVRNTEKLYHTADSSGARKDGLESRNYHIWALPTLVLANSLTKLLLGGYPPQRDGWHHLQRSRPNHWSGPMNDQTDSAWVARMVWKETAD